MKAEKLSEKPCEKNNKVLRISSDANSDESWLLIMTQISKNNSHGKCFRGKYFGEGERSLNRGPAWNFWIISFTREAFLLSMRFYDFFVKRTKEKKWWWINNQKNWFPKDHNLQSQNEERAQKSHEKEAIFDDSARRTKCLDMQ